MSEFDITTAVSNMENHSSSLYPRSERLSFFDLALSQHDWENSVILDLGGNRGNLLEDLKEKQIGKSENYYNLDVDHEALNFGESNNPEANWISYNAFNPMYNKEGVQQQKFPFEDNKFDLVCCYSVYSHTTFENLIHDLDEIQRVTKPNGKVALTFVDLDSINFFLTKRRQDYPQKFIINKRDIEESFRRRDEYIYFVDHDLLVDEIHNPEGINHLVTVYNYNWLLDKLNSIGIDAKIHHPKTGHIQKTLVFNAKN